MSIMLLAVAMLSPGLANATARETTSCSQATFTVNSAADATALSQCSTLHGSVLIDTKDTEVDLSGPVHINGDLTLANAEGFITLRSTSITTVSGTFEVDNVTALSTLAFKSLTSVGSLQFQTLPSLFELGFDSGVTAPNSVVINDTSLGSLDGLALNQVIDLTITNNLRLTKVDLPLVRVLGNLSLVRNSQAFSVNLPDLVTVKNLAISNSVQLELPSLQEVDGTMLLDTNYFSEISAPILQTCGRGLSIVNNPELESILLPELSYVTGPLLVRNNTSLRTVNDLNDLTNVSSYVEFSGNFFDVELPSVVYVGGAFAVTSTYNITDSCIALQQLAPVSQGGGGQVHGTFTCLSNDDTATPDDPDSSTTTAYSSSTTGIANSIPTSSQTSPIPSITTSTSSTTSTPTSAGSLNRSEASKYGVSLAMLFLIILL